MFDFRKNEKEEPYLALSRIAVNCSIKLRDEFQQFIPPGTGFSTPVIPFLALGHNFVALTVTKKYGEQSLADLKNAIAASASVLAEVLDKNIGSVSRQRLGQVFVAALDATRDRVFECLEQSGTNPDVAIRSVSLLLLQKIGITKPDRDTLERSIEIVSASFSSAISSLETEYKPNVAERSKRVFDLFKKRPSLSEQEIFKRAQGCLGELLTQSGQSGFQKLIETGYLGFKSHSAYYCADYASIDSDTICYVKLSDFPMLKTVRAAVVGGPTPMIPEELMLVCLTIAKSVKPWKA